MIYMIFDVETTGLIKSKPYIVSIAVKLFDVKKYKTKTGDRRIVVKEVYDMYHIVKPPKEGYEIPIESSNIHGITTKIAQTQGRPIEEILSELHDMQDRFQIHTIVAHNIEFDIGVLSMQVYRFDKRPVTFNDKIYYLTPYCTMQESTNLLKLKTTSKFGRTYFKYPRLKQLYEHFFPNENFEEHNAKADVEACARCFFKLKYDIDIVNN